MQIIAIYIQKGGTGKTTTAGNAAYALRELDSAHNVLMIDADPQGNLSSWLHPEPFHYELADVLKGGAALTDAICAIRPRIDLLPTFAINGGLKAWAETALPSTPFAFHELIDAIAAQGNYTHCVCDLSPGTSILERALLAVADVCIPIARPEMFSIDGLEIFEDCINRVRKDLRAHVATPLLLINGINLSFGVHKAYAKQLETTTYDIYTTGQSTRLTEAQTAHQFINEYDPRNKTIKEYKEIARRVHNGTS